MVRLKTAVEGRPIVVWFENSNLQTPTSTPSKSGENKLAFLCFRTVAPAATREDGLERSFGVSYGWPVYFAEVRGFVFACAGANTD